MNKQILSKKILLLIIGSILAASSFAGENDQGQSIVDNTSGSIFEEQPAEVLKKCILTRLRNNSILGEERCYRAMICGK